MKEVNTITISVDEYNELNKYKEMNLKGLVPCHCYIGMNDYLVFITNEEMVKKYKSYNFYISNKYKKQEKQINNLRNYVDKLKDLLEKERSKKWYNKLLGI